MHAMFHHHRKRIYQIQQCNLQENKLNSRRRLYQLPLRYVGSRIHQSQHHNRKPLYTKSHHDQERVVQKIPRSGYPSANRIQFRAVRQVHLFQFQ